MRIAFFPYDLIITISLSFLLGAFFRKILLKTYTYKKEIDKLIPFALAYILVSVIFMFVFEEFPVKLFLYDALNKPKPPQLGPQAIPVDEKRVAALIYNSVIWVLCLVIVARYFLQKEKRVNSNF